ncbi:nascent polypeptide-associated complex subunit alpha, muscle-specific form-like [Sciurus carolinensis]|uniref:nascent polypeptide-associated complex subunit alpha, muscle-specific form-like n=1 Tax=Sciurus carolinensis TaxID=30640 RepID=UPI001FB42236|nr:nascent polypeptide-associated complex subunit alpha, muscle-specific form-like [Sciurus carolinensis]
MLPKSQPRDHGEDAEEGGQTAGLSVASVALLEFLLNPSSQLMCWRQPRISRKQIGPALVDPFFKQEDRKSALNSQLVNLMVMCPKKRTLDKKVAEMEVKGVDMESGRNPCGPRLSLSGAPPVPRALAGRSPRGSRLSLSAAPPAPRALVGSQPARFTSLPFRGPAGSPRPGRVAARAVHVSPFPRPRRLPAPWSGRSPRGSRLSLSAAPPAPRALAVRSPRGPRLSLSAAPPAPRALVGSQPARSTSLPFRSPASPVRCRPPTVSRAVCGPRGVRTSAGTALSARPSGAPRRGRLVPGPGVLRGFPSVPTGLFGVHVGESAHRDSPLVYPKRWLRRVVRPLPPPTLGVS